MSHETAYWVAFSVFPGIGPVRFKLLRDFFGSAQAAWNATPVSLRETGLPDGLVKKFIDFRSSFSLSSYLKQLQTERVSVLTLEDDHYPRLLKTISDAPFVLYIKGKKTPEPWDINTAIGIVGTRRITEYGRDVTKRLVQELVAYGFTIVSGLAYGVDAVAHETAIQSGGKTIAVLGCGIDIIAPPSNAYLYKQIVNGAGAIVSEMPLGLRPNKGLFPARNRIISGLSVGVIVTEGADDSGALITARNAGEQGREVFAVPGPITSVYSRGPALLIKQGAMLVESITDIIEALGIDSKISSADHKHASVYVAKSEHERKILACLADRRMHIDALVKATNLTIANVSVTLSYLEIAGIIKDFGGKEYGKI